MRFAWQDNTPFIYNDEWFLPQENLHRPQPCQKSHFVEHLGMTLLSAYTPLYEVMLHDPTPAQYTCVGYTATFSERTWIQIPCDMVFPSTLLTCHIDYKQESITSSPSLFNTSSCEYNEISLCTACITIRRSQRNTQPQGQCMHIHNHSSHTVTMLLDRHLKHSNVTCNIGMDTRQLMFVVNTTIKLNANVVCISHQQQTDMQCGSDEFKCISDAVCIPTAQQCNAILDCNDGSDEIHCSHVCSHSAHNCSGCAWPECLCSAGFYQCENGGCIPVSVVCDNVHNCADHSDEKHCQLVCQDGWKACDDGLLCVEESRWCDGVQNCVDLSDEKCDISSCHGYMCRDDGPCIPKSYLTDTITDCPNKDDEGNNVNKPFTLQQRQNCHLNFSLQCGKFSEQCYPISQHCVYEEEYNGAISYCRMAGHLDDCKDFECSGSYKCPGAYCIPFASVCDGKKDCVEGQDEEQCNNMSCPGLFYCEHEGICLGKAQVCNGKIDCKDTGDDEKYCYEKTIGTVHRQSNDLVIRVSQYTRAVQISQQNITSDNFNVNSLEESIFSVMHIDLSFNVLTSISSKMFIHFPFMRYLLLQHNQIHHIDEMALSYFKKLYILDFSHNQLSSLQIACFGVTVIEKIDLSFNAIHHVEDGFFLSMTITQYLKPSSHYMCCMHKAHAMHSVKGCHSHEASCRDLIPYEVLAYTMWVVLSLMIITYIIRFYQQHKHSHKISLMFYQLTCADALVLLYMLFIAVFNLRFKDKFFYERHNWRGSMFCRTTGFVSLLSMQMSNTITSLIAFWRMCAVVLPFHAHLYDQYSSKLIPSSWFVCSITAAIPHVLHYWTDLSIVSSNNICLFQYPVYNCKVHVIFSSVLMSINSFLFLITTSLSFVTYGQILRQNQTLPSTTSSAPRRERQKKMKKNTMQVVIGALCNWSAFSVLYLLSTLGVEINDISWVVLCISVVPSSSIFNAIYT